MPKTNTRQSKDELRRLYEEALESFVAKVKQDHYIIAAILFGSLAYDDIWEKSDIDIMLIGKEEKMLYRTFSLIENGINIQAHLGTRSNFKALIERTLQGSMIHSIITKSTLLFSSDDSIKEYYHNALHVGSRDREYQVLKAAGYILPVLTKAEKWLYVKKDVTYSFPWLMYLMSNLAEVEVLLHGDVACREVIKQALNYNPAFFSAVYLDLIQQPKDEERVRKAITLINDYLDEKIHILFKPILAHLATARGVRSTTELHEHLRKKIQLAGDELGHLSFTYEWLAGKGVIRRVSSPVRLMEKSRITLDEAAYYYDSDDMQGEDDATDDSN